MKKTLVALAVTAFAASASAVTVYENEGTKVDFDGSLRVLLEKQSAKENNQRSTDGHSNLKNQGSRFGISAKHNITNDFYALGRYETRFNSGASNTSGWGDIVTNKAFVGFGGYGHQVTFGKQNVIGDEIGQAGYDNAYDVGSANIGWVVSGPYAAVYKGYDILTSSSDSAVFYKYTGVKGLTLGANYNFANDRDSNGEVSRGKAKNGYGVGAIYTHDIAEGQALTFSAGYTRDNYAYVKPVVDGTAAKNKDGIYFGLKYATKAFDVAVDGGRGVVKYGYRDGADLGNTKTRLNFVRAGASFAATDAVKVYGNYSYGTLKVEDYKNTAHQFMLGSSYKLHKNVFTFVEGRLIKNKDSDGDKRTDKAIGVGLRVFW